MPAAAGADVGSPLALATGGAVLAVIASFVVGALSPAAWLAAALGKDVRRSGSGNPGATNAGRVLGWKWGVLVGVLDVAKGWVPTWIVLHLYGSTLAMAAGVAAVLGHVFSPFLQGRGGKGVATTLGAVLGVAPWLALVAAVVFAVLVLILRRVGYASVGSAIALVVAGALTLGGVLPLAARPSIGAAGVLLGLLVLVRHRSNLVAAWRRRRAFPTE